MEINAKISPKYKINSYNYFARGGTTMSKLIDIKNRIDQMDGGAFQNLCDAYLSYKGYKNIYSLGMLTGTDKTTKGNPDTYFLTAENKYVFVMYTTQKTDFLKKAIEDIDIRTIFAVSLLSASSFAISWSVKMSFSFLTFSGSRTNLAKLVVQISSRMAHCDICVINCLYFDTVECDFCMCGSRAN